MENRFGMIYENPLYVCSKNYLRMTIPHVMTYFYILANHKRFFKERYIESFVYYPKSTYLYLSNKNR